jgi:hypothetical protein
MRPDSLPASGEPESCASRENLSTAYRRFLSETDPEPKDDTGKELIRAIFGRDAIAEDSIR